MPASRQRTVSRNPGRRAAAGEQQRPAAMSKERRRMKNDRQKVLRIRAVTRGCFDSNIDQPNHKGKEKPTSFAQMVASNLTDRLISNTV
jgi:hypothetical protein